MGAASGVLLACHGTLEQRQLPKGWCLRAPRSAHMVMGLNKLGAAVFVSFPSSNRSIGLFDPQPHDLPYPKDPKKQLSFGLVPLTKRNGLGKHWVATRLTITSLSL